MKKNNKEKGGKSPKNLDDWRGKKWGRMRSRKKNPVIRKYERSP